MQQGKPIGASPGSLDFDGVCQNIRAAVDTVRTHAISLHDEKGDIVWLTESSMGPDEHNAVREAYESFSDPKARPILAYDLGDFRSAVLFRVVNASRAMIGAVMIVADTRGLQQDNKGVARLMTPKLQRALAEYAAMRPGSAKPPAAAGPAVTGSALPTELSLADSMRSPKPVVAAPSVGDTPPAAVLPAAPTSAVTAEIDRLHAALRRTPIALSVQRLVPLTKGSQLKRYEVLLRSGSSDAPNVAPQAMLKTAVDNGLGSMIDRRVLTTLISWLVHHPEAWRTQAVMFSVNLTRTALLDEHFIRFVGLCLAKASLPQAMIGFEIDVPTALKLGPKAAGVASALERLGCPLILDDFGMRTECFELLRLPGVRYIKLATDITAKMRTDKLSQAAITAVVQMARVLGMHTVAKRTETAAEHEWLTALGVDFVQSNALSPAATIDSLLNESKPKA